MSLGEKLLRTSRLKLSVAVLVASSHLSSPAVAADQYYHVEIPSINADWKTDASLGWHKLSIDETSQTFGTSSIYAVQTKVNGINYELCEEYNLGPCASSETTSVAGVSLLPVCLSPGQENCIEGISVGTSKRMEAATYKNSVSGYTTKGDTKAGIPAGGTASIWSSSTWPHTGGNEYSIIAHLEWRLYQGRVSVSNFSMRVAGVQERSNEFTVLNMPSACLSPMSQVGTGYKTPCANSNPGKNGCFYTLEKICAYEQVFAPNTRIGVSLRLTNKIAGWFEGRLKDPSLTISPFSPSASKITIEASPVDLPKLHTRWNSNQISSNVPALNGGGWGEGNSMSGPSGPTALAWVDGLRESAKDTATGVQTLWSMTSLTGAGGQCFTSQSKVYGMVTTNAMAFMGGAPQYKNGTLSYQVAGLHYLPDGTSPALGTYDLMLASDTARCIYGFNKAPISATISVTGGVNKNVATTLISEKNGWLKLAAYGFTYSSKTINIKLTQKVSTITCRSISKPIKTKKVTALTPKCPAGYKKF